MHIGAGATSLDVVVASMAAQNQLVGTIPSALGQLRQLTAL